MVLIKSFCALFLISLISLSGYAQSQNQFPGGSDNNELLVLASGGDNHLRITALGLIQRVRLEVLSQNGDRIYDSEYQNGSTIGLNLAEQNAQLLQTGYYGCMVTLEDLAGRVSHRWGTFRVKDGQDGDRLTKAAIIAGSAFRVAIDSYYFQLGYLDKYDSANLDRDICAAIAKIFMPLEKDVTLRISLVDSQTGEILSYTILSNASPKNILNELRKIP